MSISCYSAGGLFHESFRWQLVIPSQDVLEWQVVINTDDEFTERGQAGMRVRYSRSRIQDYVLRPFSIAAQRHVDHNLKKAVLAVMLQCNYVTIQNLVPAWSTSRVRQEAMSTKYLVDKCCHDDVRSL